MRQLNSQLLEHFKMLDGWASEIEARIKLWHGFRADTGGREKVPEIGPLTASVLAAALDNARNFDNGRQLAAWLGPVLRQQSIGGNATLRGMRKRGGAYLRILLNRGARFVTYRARHHSNENSWLFNSVE